MGCWGITAFESDAGLDAVDLIRRNLPDDGKLEAKQVIELLKSDIWCAPPDTADGESHTSPMAFAELMVKFLDRDMDGLDDKDVYFFEGPKFSTLTSFTADRKSLQWVHDYLMHTLKYSREDAACGKKWGGWFRERDWINWQTHMEQLIGRMDQLLEVPEDTIELLKYSGQGTEMKEELNGTSSQLSMPGMEVSG